jgi:hypothetical protein
MRKSVIHTVDFLYRRQELLALFMLAVREDVEKGGRYDARSDVINVWSHPWITQAMREESTLMGILHCSWGEENRIYRIDTYTGFSLEHLLQELGVLEWKALWTVKHGTLPSMLSTASPSKVRL